MKPTLVFVTVDVECREERQIGRSIIPPIGYDTRVWGRFENLKEELGIRFIMRTLEQEGLIGTFFVEALGANFFGTSGLNDICTEILHRGHDVQLHLHPNFRRIQWRSLKIDPLPHLLSCYSSGEQLNLIRDGLKVLISCGVPANQICCFRAGDFAANNDTYHAMSACGITVSSNYLPEYISCKIRRPNPVISPWTTEYGVIEVPIGSTRIGSSYRPMQITAVSCREIIHFLETARHAGARAVTLLTHPFEFFMINARDIRHGKPNPINIHRLQQLCRYLSSHKIDFQTVQMRSAAEFQISTDPIAPPAANPQGLFRRHIEQLIKRISLRTSSWTV